MTTTGSAKSIQERLRNLARASGEEYQRTLTRYANERFLYRLGTSSARDRCVLKGASLLTIWLADPYRATRDIDVLISGRTDDEALRSVITEICAIECPEDAMQFDASTIVVEPIRAEEEYSGKRARFQARLGNIKIGMQLDLGVGDALTTAPTEVDYPTMLTMPSPQLLGYPREATIAEKFEAMVKLETRNSRMKDFHDVWALAGAFAFDGRALQEAIAACFERRATPWTVETPRPLTAAFYQLAEFERRWQNYLNAGAVLEPPPAQFAAVGERIVQFLGPIRNSIVANESFDERWRSGGPWTSTTRPQSSKK